MCRLLTDEQKHSVSDIAGTCKTMPIDAWTYADLECIAVGAFSPLTGFLGKADYLSVLSDMRLKSGEIWPIPITLAVEEDLASALALDEVLSLTYNGETVAALQVTSCYPVDKEWEAQCVFGTADKNHPGVARLFEKPDHYVGGEVTVFKRQPSRFPKYNFTPREVRELFQKRGWESIVGFQTRNPIHRAHEYIQKAALETVDGLFVQPLVGETKADDIPATVRIRSYEALLSNYYPANRTALGVYPAAMRYAGPREAVLHALVRKNYGCTHFIVGRDHAGVGDYYGTYDAQRIFRHFPPQDIGIVPLFFEHSFYCRRCEGMASSKTCPHNARDRVILSGTKVREMLKAGKHPPKEFSRPEVVALLIEGYQRGR